MRTTNRIPYICNDYVVCCCCCGVSCSLPLAYKLWQQSRWRRPSIPSYSINKIFRYLAVNCELSPGIRKMYIFIFDLQLAIGSASACVFYAETATHFLDGKHRVSDRVRECHLHVLMPRFRHARSWRSLTAFSNSRPYRSTSCFYRQTHRHTHIRAPAHTYKHAPIEDEWFNKVDGSKCHFGIFLLRTGGGRGRNGSVPRQIVFGFIESEKFHLVCLYLFRAGCSLCCRSSL